MAESLYTIADVVRVWGISERTLRRLMRQGALPFRKIGNLVRFQQADLDACLHKKNKL